MLAWLTTYAEVTGVVATLFVLLSFAVNGEVKIRCINIIGAAIFVIYGLLISALSVWLLNGILIIVHIYKLVKYSRKQVYHTIPRTIFNFKNNQIQK